MALNQKKTPYNLINVTGGLDFQQHEYTNKQDKSRKTKDVPSNGFINPTGGFGFPNTKKK